MTPTCTASPSRPGKLSARAEIVLLGCACAGASAFLYAVDPSRHAVYPQCLLYNATGIYCAGCGATRALYALLHGRVLTALHDNALFVALLPAIALALGLHAFRAWQADAWPPVRYGGRRGAVLGATLFAVMILFSIARNLPQFAWLRPL